MLVCRITLLLPKLSARLWAARVAMAIGLLTSSARAQSPPAADVMGFVVDSSGHPVSAASVSLEASTPPSQTLSTQTDARGSYDFAGVREGAYKIHVRIAGYREAHSELFSLKANESKRLDFALQTSKPEKTSTQAPEFFDEPAFTVAGVTDTTSLGTHGADTVVRTTESLVRETAALGRSTAGGHLGGPSVGSEELLRAAVRQSPESFDANRRLGQKLLADGRGREAVPYLDQAARLHPDDNENTYDLALAYVATGEYELADSNLRGLLRRDDRADTHHLLGDVEEKLDRPLEAVHEYQRAAEIAPSEPNLFDWGSELLLHRAFDPAGEVFTKGNRLFPKSSRLLVGLGVTFYARGSYDQAVGRLCEASDLDPDAPSPYLFLGRIQTIEPTQSKEVTDRLARFARLWPQDAMANYYYAMSLWKARKGPEDTANLQQIETLLNKSVQLDPRLGPGFLQLGVLYEERRNMPRALEAYQQAAAVAPQLEQAHYRLAQAYRKTGDAQKATAELALYEATSKQSVEQAEREQREIRSFVYTLRDRPSGSTTAQ